MNYNDILDAHPEFYYPVNMLFLPLLVNGVPITALLDTGAQASVVSKTGMAKCRLEPLVDRRFGGMVRGVGKTNLLGRVHLINITIGSETFEHFLMIMAQDLPLGVEMVLGLDFLKIHEGIVNVSDGANGALQIRNTSFPFLSRADSPNVALHAVQELLSSSSSSSSSSSDSAEETENVTSSAPDVMRSMMRMMRRGRGRSRGRSRGRIRGTGTTTTSPTRQRRRRSEESESSSTKMMSPSPMAQMMRNPELMAQMTSNPMMQQMMRNPELMQQMMKSMMGGGGRDSSGEDLSGGEHLATGHVVEQEVEVEEQELDKVKHLMTVVDGASRENVEFVLKLTDGDVNRATSLLVYAQERE